MSSQTENSSLAELLDALADVWFNRQTNQPPDAVAAYRVLLETLNAYQVSEPQITNLLLPRLGLTKFGAITDMADLERLVMDRLMSAQDGNAPGHYEVDNALRCAVLVAKEGSLLSGVSEQQSKDAIKASVSHLQGNSVQSTIEK